MQQRNNSLRVTSTEDGLHLDGSILWLDGHQAGQLSFLSSAASGQPTPEGPQVIATEETVRLLEVRKRRPNALVCQYNRPFSIGKLKMELLPSGSVLGGASLYVETDRGRLLYAPAVQPEKSSLVRQMQLKKAQTLVLGAFHPDPSSPMPSRKKEKERLAAAVKKQLADGKSPVIFCQPIATAQELTKLLTEEGIAVCVHSSIYNLNRVYEQFGSPLGSYSIFNPRKKRDRVLLLPLSSRPQKGLRRPIPEGPVFLVEETLTPSNPPGPNVDVADRFFISSYADGRDIREIINAVGPKEVLIFGPYAKRYCEDLKNCHPSVRPLFSNAAPPIF